MRKRIFSPQRGSWTKQEEWRPHRNVSKLRRPAISQTRGPPIKCKCLFMCLSVVTDVYRCSGISLLRLTCIYVYIYTSQILPTELPKGALNTFFKGSRFNFSESRSHFSYENIVRFYPYFEDPCIKRIIFDERKSARNFFSLFLSTLSMLLPFEEIFGRWRFSIAIKGTGRKKRNGRSQDPFGLPFTLKLGNRGFRGA